MAIPVLGVDPGKNGGFAFIDPEGTAGVLPFPKITYEDNHGSSKTVVDYAQVEAYWGDLRMAGVEHAYVETMVKYAGKNQTGSSAAVYGFNCGYVRGILEAQKWKIHDVVPITWQRHYTDSKTSDFFSNTEWKNHLKRLADLYFPYLKITLSVSDALLIAKYGYDTTS